MVQATVPRKCTDFLDLLASFGFFQCHPKRRLPKPLTQAEASSFRDDLREAILLMIRARRIFKVLGFPRLVWVRLCNRPRGAPERSS